MSQKRRDALCTRTQTHRLRILCVCTAGLLAKSTGTFSSTASNGAKVRASERTRAHQLDAMVSGLRGDSRIRSRRARAMAASVAGLPSFWLAIKS